MAQRNQFLDDDLSDKTSLIHLLDNNDSEKNSEEVYIKKKSTLHCNRCV